MTVTSVPPWESKRTEETRQIEDALHKAGFANVSSYRYNPASIRIRVIDSRFEGMAYDQRDAMVEPCLEQFPESTQADIMNLFTFAPSELQRSPKSGKEFMLNTEFEDPSPSLL